MNWGKRIIKSNMIVIHDLFMVFLAWELAWLARFNFDISHELLLVSVSAIPAIIIIQSVIFYKFNLHRGIWRFSGLADCLNIFRAALLGGVCISLFLFILFRLQGVPRTVLILYPVFLTFFLGGSRLGYRLWKDHTISLKAISDENRIIIIGAGRAGEMLVRDILRDGNYLPVGFIDDNHRLRNFEIHGVRVLGPVDKLDEFVEIYNPATIFIAVPSATNKQMQRIVEHVEHTNLPARTLPKLEDMVSKGPSLDKLKELSIEDLLGREKVELDWGLIHKGLSNKVVMVSGGGGSIGSELCHQIASLVPEKLIIYEISEFNLYKIYQSLQSAYPYLEVIAELGDVCDKSKVEHTVRLHRPNIIFHAAAYKHVPILQSRIREAVKNNIFGTIYMANAADEFGCDKFIFISTDKAVNPENVLGLTKRASEIYCECRNNSSNTGFITVRFGNVLGTDGSVIPLFQEQIRNGGPVTVTHPEVKRYFMTRQEACQLILQSSVIGAGGEIFILDMGRPVKIAYLADQLIKLSGKNPNSDIKIEYIGLRPGEKLSEDLFQKNETRKKTLHKKILLATHSDIGKELFVDKLEALKEALIRFDEKELKKSLNELVKETQSD